MSSLTVRNVPDDAKHRFRQVAAAHGRSMEEHLRHLIIEADFGVAGAPPSWVADAPSAFRNKRSGEDGTAELRRLANGAGFDPPPRLSTELEAPAGDNWVRELVRIANGAGEGVFDREPQPLREFDL